MNKSSFRAGMQVHAVPDEERASDASGRRLPFGFEYADSNLRSRQPVEKGPFGKSTSRRSMSRSKTATPATREDLAKQEDLRAIDSIFRKHKEEQNERQGQRDLQKAPPVPSLPHTRSAPDIAAPAASLPTNSHPRKLQEPTEVILYGFGIDYGYAAIDFYEKASNGLIYEDYERDPPNPRYKTTLSARRGANLKPLPREARLKINQYRGGDHWIKVTLDSPEAADLACHYSPHIINGFSVRCEPYRGVGPNEDVAIPADANGEHLIASSIRRPKSPQQRHPQPYNSMPARTQSTLVATPFDGSLNDEDSSPTSSMTASSATATALNGAATSPAQPNSNFFVTSPAKGSPAKPLRVPGAKRAVLLPATDALLPVQPWPQRIFGGWPLIGSLVGGDGSEIIGGVVPRKEVDKEGLLGEFDWEKASFWWRACWWIDQAVGTDLCGIKGED